MHVQSVHTKVKCRQVHALKHLHECLTFAFLHMHNLYWVFLHGSFDETKKMLLVHTRRSVNVSVYLQNKKRGGKKSLFFLGYPQMIMTERGTRRCDFYLTNIVKVSMGNLFLCCKLLHLIQKDVHLEFGAEILKPTIAKRLSVGKEDISPHYLVLNWFQTIRALQK